MGRSIQKIARNSNRKIERWTYCVELYYFGVSHSIRFASPFLCLSVSHILTLFVCVFCNEIEMDIESVWRERTAEQNMLQVKKGQYSLYVNKKSATHDVVPVRHFSLKCYDLMHINTCVFFYVALEIDNLFMMSSILASFFTSPLSSLNLSLSQILSEQISIRTI